MQNGPSPPINPNSGTAIFRETPLSPEALTFWAVHGNHPRHVSSSSVGYLCWHTIVIVVLDSSRYFTLFTTLHAPKALVLAARLKPEHS